MAFKLQPNPVFEASITIPVPGGGEDKIKFKFKRLGKKALRELFKTLEDANTAGSEVEIDDAEFLLNIVEGWTGVDEEFSREALELLCDNYPGAVGAVIQNYSNKMFGAIEKN